MLKLTLVYLIESKYLEDCLPDVRPCYPEDKIVSLKVACVIGLLYSFRISFLLIFCESSSVILLKSTYDFKNTYELDF